MTMNTTNIKTVLTNSCREVEYKGIADKQFFNQMAKNFNTAETTTEESFYCPKCQNRQMYMQIKWENGVPYEFAVLCDCVKERKEAKKLIASGLSPLMTKKIENYKVTNDLNKKIKILALENIKAREWFFIGGQSGAGKTHICAAIANQLLENGSRVDYVLWNEKASQLKAIQLDYEEYSKEINKIKRVEVLLIDDLFKNKDGIEPSSADVKLAFEILNFRYNNNLKTIISTEKTIMEIEQIDTAIAGRISERSGRFLLNIAKEDKRNYRKWGN